MTKAANWGHMNSYPQKVKPFVLYCETPKHLLYTITLRDEDHTIVSLFIKLGFQRV